ncbi:hypothetical protein NX059_002377 [Plenodomus lindquistii]|nr:hypothetical protein NX059_002377 [Plenodomus lindquistii]
MAEDLRNGTSQDSEKLRAFINKPWLLDAAVEVGRAALDVVEKKRKEPKRDEYVARLRVARREMAKYKAEKSEQEKTV